MQIYYDDDDRDDHFFPDGGDETATQNSMQAKYADDTANFKVDFDGGIKKDRGCTDILCLIIFWAFIGAMGFLTVYGFQNGKINKLTAPIDGAKNFCGFGPMEGYPKMMLTNFHPAELTDIPYSGVCIKECPKVKGNTLTSGNDCLDNEKVKCSERQTYITKDVFDFCLPTGKEALEDDEKAGYDELVKQLKTQLQSSPFGDMYKCSTSMYYAMGLSLVWSIVYIYLMSMFAEPLAWCCVILIQIGLFAGSGALFYLWDDDNKRIAALKETPQWSNYSDDQKSAIESEPMKILVLGVVVGIAALLFLCMIICKKGDLQRAIDVIDAAADYIAHNKRVILVPNLHFVFTFLFTLIWIGALLCVVSLNKINASSIVPQGRDIDWDKKWGYAALFMFFGFLWVTAWIEYTSRFIVIVGAVTYYFNNHRDNQEEEIGADISLGFKWAYINHQGSIAVGAFIIAVVRFIKFVFYYLAKKMEKASGDNPAVKAAVKCAVCLLNCIERICDYLNESAFCYMAVTGDSFFPAAWNGFLLNLKHGFKFAFANMIAKVFIFLGKVGIVVANLGCFYLFMKQRGDLEEVPMPIWPVLVVGFMTYLAASLFLSLFDEAVMALLTSLCVDMDANGGEPVFGPATFHDNYVKKAQDQE